MNYVRISYDSWSILHTKSIKYLDKEEKDSISEIINSFYSFKSSEVMFGLNYRYMGDENKEVTKKIGGKVVTISKYDSISFQVTKCKDDWFLIKFENNIKEINGIFLCNGFHGLLEFLKENIIKY